MTEARVGRHTACKPMLDGTEELIAGYKALHNQEGKYTAIALQEMPDAVAIWYRYLALYDRTHRGEHESPFDDRDDQHKAWHLRLRLSGVAVATAKLALDAALAGYYSQAYALLRHMLETWEQMVYVRINPAAAQLWFPDGVREPVEPNRSTITNRIRKHGKQDKELGNNAAVVERLIVEFHKGAHPSAMIVAQSAADDPEWLYLGGKYDRRYLANVVSKGTVAMALLLHEIALSIPVDDVWRSEFRSIGQARAAWQDAESRQCAAITGDCKRD